MLALLGKATKTGKAVNIGRKLLAKGGEKEQKKKDDRRRYSEPSSAIIPRGSVAPANTSVLAPVPKLDEVSEDTAKGDDDILVIKDTVISIHKILKTTFKNESILLKQRRKAEENRKRAEREEELEAKKEDDKKKKSGGGKMNIPMSIMDRIKAFIAGFVAYRLVPFIPQLLELVKFIPPVVDFFANTGIFLIDAFSSFLVIAKKPIDWAKGAIENIGGEEALEKFEGLLSAFTTFANIAIIAGMASIGGGGRDSFGRGGRGPKTTGIGGKGVGKTRTTSPAAARRFASRFGRDAAEKRFGKDAVKNLGGKFGRSRATNAIRKGATTVADKIGGRGGVKALASLGKIGKFIKVPVIGGIISAVLALMSGEPIGKALFAGIGTTIGGALGTLIPIPVLGTILGGFIGDYVGNLLGTLFFGGGLKEAGAQLGKDILGIFTGVGKGAKAIFDWVFGGGLFDLIKNISGGVFKFVTYILNPGGLLFDSLKQGGKIAEAIFNFAKSIVGNAVGGVVEGSKRATGGFFDAITFNVFDFDKQNKVEKKEEGGPVGDSETNVEKKLERTTFKTSTKKPDKVKIGKDIGGAGKLVKAGFNKKTVGYLVAASNEMKRIPLIGSIMGSAIDLLLGQRPEKSMLQSFSTNIVALNDFATVDEVNQGSLTGLLSASAMQTGGEVFGSTYGPGTIAGERDSATGALLATDPEQYQIVLSRYLETAVDGKVPNVFSAMNLAETIKENEPGPLDSLLGPFKGLFGGKEKGAPTPGPGGPTPGTGGPGGGKQGVATGAVGASDLYTEIGANAQQWDIFRNTVALIESGGKYDIFGGSGDHYDGRYQMGEAAKIDGSKIAGVEYPGHSDDPNNQARAAYRANPELQETIFTAFTVANHRYLMGNETYASANVERKLEILGYAHNQGMGGAEKWMTTGEVGADGFGTKGTKYTDMIAANFRAKKSGGELQIAEGAVDVPSLTPFTGGGEQTSSTDSSDDSSGGDVSVGGETIAAIGKDLISQGFAVAEHPDFTKQTPSGSYTPGSGSVSNVHKGKGHYEGRAIDVTDWRGTLEDSQARYRSVLDSLSSNPAINMLIHDTWGFQDSTGKSGPGSHGHPQHMHIETKMEGGGSIGSRKSDTTSISDYAPYEDSDSGPQIIVKTIIVEKKMPGESAIMPIPLGGGGSSDGVNINAYSNLSAGAG